MAESARREPAAETEALIEEARRWADGLLGKGPRYVALLTDALVREQEAREHWQGRADYWRVQAFEALSETEALARQGFEEIGWELQRARDVVGGRAGRKGPIATIVKRTLEALSLHRGSHDA